MSHYVERGWPHVVSVCHTGARTHTPVILSAPLLDDSGQHTDDWRFSEVDRKKNLACCFAGYGKVEGVKLFLRNLETYSCLIFTPCALPVGLFLVVLFSLYVFDDHRVPVFLNVQTGFENDSLKA